MSWFYQPLPLASTLTVTDVTVALDATSTSVTTAAGTCVPDRSVALSGSASTTGQGSVVIIDDEEQLQGSAVTTAQQDVTRSLTVRLRSRKVGGASTADHQLNTQVAAVQQGTVVFEKAVLLGGTGVAVSQQSLTKTTACLLVGIQRTVSRGNLVYSESGESNEAPVWGSATGATFNLRRGQSFNMANSLRFTDPEDEVMEITQVSGTLPSGVTYDPFTGVLSASTSATLGLSGDLVFQADDGSQLTPILWGSDITSGPSTGNSDTTYGQDADENGCYVTVWGVNLGLSQGTSTMTCNGAAVTVIPYWGPAVPPWSPANFVNTYQNWQTIIFQVPSTATSGLGEIVVTVGGRVSKTVVATYGDSTTGWTRVIQDGLPFTVRSGNIRFASLTGNNSNDGRWDTPYLTIEKLRSTQINGDIGYVCDGVTAATFLQPGNDHATEAMPRALVAYPGATVTIGSLSSLATTIVHVRSRWRVLAKFRCYGGDWFTVLLNHVGESLVSTDALDGSRLVGCDLQAPNANQPSGTLSIGGSNRTKILFNEFSNVSTNISDAGLSSLYHVIYSSGLRDTPSEPPAEVGREIAFNYFHGCRADTAIHMWNFSNTPGGPAADVKDYNVHHNVIVDQGGYGIRFANHGDFNECYNNIVIRAGRASIGFTNDDMTVKTFNNTLIDGGQTLDSAQFLNRGGLYWAGGVAEPWPSVQTVYNNVIVQTNSQPYIRNGTNSSYATKVVSNNLYFGNGVPPSEDVNPLNVDPEFTQFTTEPWDLRPATGSPLIDAGVDTSSIVTYDLDGVPCPQNGTFDIGAYESE